MQKDEIKEEVDHLTEIKERDGQGRPGLQTNKSANQILDEIYEDMDNLAIKSPTIFKVNVALRESNPDAYTPKMISIGPYHKKNQELHSMEKYKLLYLRRFLRRKEGLDVESCIRELEELKDEALMCYDEIEDLIDSDNNTGQFLKMLLFDGCFLVEYIRERCGIKPTAEDMIIPGGCLDNQVSRDLLLLENQLPFFVLTKLHDMTKEETDELPFTKMVKWIFFHDLPKLTPASFNESVSNTAEIKHLLQVIHMSCHPSEMKTNNLTGNISKEAEHSRKSLCCNLLQIIRSKEMPKDKDNLTWQDNMPNATELREAGVGFSKVGNIYTCLAKDNLGDSTSLFDIRFENGLMTIPCFKVSDNTETVLRNFIAYEQQSPDIDPKYFSEFAVFMDHLIDSEKDVTLLRVKGIIANDIGDDKEVANLFNKIGKGVGISSDFHYKEVCGKVLQHCEQPWNRMKASLRRNYFHSPWAGVSTVAAVILLLLTVTQTVLSFISVLK
ncbi:PREDICTED: UPF0481 protein At3g47200-like [Nicotiana attenuata]|uniref:Upf0481 protein n=1 Tax=Nicotiana attenuata TaxID=49451 RepID=A0A1J6J6M8_NICAT|nr:PREDICTED: UPF0481 protein At3g47200-like [Nicotiana attenuata]OIT05487.1 upf0481 protein [Nicotiana attenuata]